MKTRNKKWVVAFSILALFILLSLMPYFFSTKNTAYPNDIQIERQYFPNIELIGSSASGTTKIPSNVDLTKVYQLKFTSNACSSNIKVLKDGSAIGLLQFPSCESQFFGEQGGFPFQHYPERTLTYEVKGISGNFPYEFEVTGTAPYTFESEGTIYPISKSTFNYKVELYEKVTCTRSSHCPEVDIDSKTVQSFCSINNKCSIDSKDLKISDSTDEREIAPISKGIPIWVSLLIALGISGIAIFFIFKFVWRKR